MYNDRRKSPWEQSWANMGNNLQHVELLICISFNKYLCVMRKCFTSFNILLTFYIAKNVVTVETVY